MLKKSRGYHLFQISNLTFLTLLSLIMFLPILHVLAKSFSGSKALTDGIVGLLPVHFTLNNFHYVLVNPSILKSLWITVIITIAGTLINLVFTSTLAYPLSRSEYRGRRLILLM